LVTIIRVGLEAGPLSQWLYDGLQAAGLEMVLLETRHVEATLSAMGLTEDVTGMLASQVWGRSDEGVLQEHAAESNLNLQDRRLRLPIGPARELIGFPRQIGTHPGGFVLTRDRLDELVPVEPAAMADRQVIEWEKDDIDALKWMKVDVLGLGMLGCMRRSFELIVEHRGQAFDIASIPAEDPATYAMIRKADTLGTFQIESRAQMSMLPRLKPTTFYDLVVQVAIVCAGFTPGEAAQLRHSMATFKFTGGVSHFRDKLINGMVANGYEHNFAERTFSQLERFGSYGFPESHAASFALVAYASSWVKCHHPDVFCASLLNSQPMGFYAPAQVVRDAREHRVLVRPVCVNASRWNCTLERRGDGGPGFAVRLGLHMVKGLRAC
jgi:error-prone DNA polymerase